MSKKYHASAWASLFDVILSWSVIVISIYITLSITWWFYPIAIVLIGNRLLALSLICHEGLHGNISRNARINDFLGRYFCAFPTCISFSKYRRIHLLHHQGVGTENWDPDRHLYSYFPISIKKYMFSQLKELLSLRMSYSFLVYYTDIPDLLKGKALSKASDWKSFIIFQVLLLTIVLASGTYHIYFFFVLLPLLLVTQPYVLLIGGLQHGPVREMSDSEGVSRTISGSRFYMWMLLPLNINYHAEHHMSPNVPHRHLRKYSKELRKSGTILWRESYLDAVRKLFYKDSKASRPSDSLLSARRS